MQCLAVRQDPKAYTATFIHLVYSGLLRTYRLLSQCKAQREAFDSGSHFGTLKRPCVPSACVPLSMCSQHLMWCRCWHYWTSARVQLYLRARTEALSYHAVYGCICVHKMDSFSICFSSNSQKYIKILWAVLQVKSLVNLLSKLGVQPAESEDNPQHLNVRCSGKL